MATKIPLRPEWEFLCHLEDIPDGGARGKLPKGNEDQIFVVRQGDEVFVYLNDCPHNHRPLEYRQDVFLSADGGHIICWAHSAHFEIRSGICYAGPCHGKSLTPITSCVENGMIWIKPIY
ncbi:Rieske (2Fe-2S) protein [Acinetobacter baumannii]|nr:Rieske (2Fe-2S) protein [Acinetobacter baumannii]